MINFKFVKSQFKNIIIPIIIFFVLFLLILIPSLFFKKFADANEILSWTSYGWFGFILIFMFGIILINMLLYKEIDRGYMASWLITPMSRNTILNSKLFVILTSILIINITILFLQLILFAAIYNDFNKQVLGNVVLTSFSFLFLWIFWTSIIWFVMINFNKYSVGISVAFAISSFFIICDILSVFLKRHTSFAKNFEYFTITKLLFNIAFKDDINEKNNLLNFVWQLPTMLVGASGLFIIGNWIFAKKSLSI